MVHLLLSRRYYTSGELLDLQRLITLTQISVHRLFILKQLVSNSVQGSGVLKTHILQHFVQCIRILRHPKIFIVDKTESAHTQLKSDYRHIHSNIFNFDKYTHITIFVNLVKYI